MNLLKECGCRRGDNPKSVKKTTGEQEDWEGCSDDVMLGNIQAKKYIRASIIPKENVDFLAIHNAEVGRRVGRMLGCILCSKWRESDCHVFVVCETDGVEGVQVSWRVGLVCVENVLD